MTVYEHRGMVRWAETDASGLYYFPHALIWAQDAEHALCRSLDAAWVPDAKPRRAVSATYHAPFRAADCYLVKLWIDKLGTSSITFGWAILNGEKLAVEGQHVVVHLGADGRSEPVSAALRAALGHYLKEPADVGN